jgi:FK506-binding protein 1
MGVQKTVISEGNGPSPQKGDQVTMEYVFSRCSSGRGGTGLTYMFFDRYTGWLRTAGVPEEKGKQFDSTTGRGPFQTAIGVGRVIKGTSCTGT